MEDAQFWIYLAFAAIYFISKMLKKKKQPKESSEAPLDQEEQTFRRPKTFEELLGEITGQQQMLEREEEVEEPFEAQRERAIVPEPIEEIKKERVYERKFSNEQSKRDYEEAIKRPDVEPLSFKRAEDYKIGLSKREKKRAVQSAEIRNMLRTGDAKKAVILSEILSRKY